jgi:hypothetical protein
VYSMPGEVGSSPSLKGLSHQFVIG